ncbi:MAG: hypothetical protein ABI852_11020 [Gemmatimonadaceae bacterium]
MTEPNVGTHAQTRISKYATLRRRATALLCASSLMLQQACYNSVAVAGASAAPVGPVTITVNERGRILVGNRLGSLVDHVVGRIVRADSVNVEVAVETAEDVRGNMARWGGEKFTIPREGIQSMTAKKVSRVRTGLLLGGIVVGILVGLLTLHGGKSGSNGLPPDGGGNPI